MIDRRTLVAGTAIAGVLAYLGFATRGYVFNDGPQPTGLRYRINGVAMTFTAA